MKKAFTMVELVFVIILVGILSFFISESLQRNTLQEAADQVISHIRYTQHLAMMDEKFTSTESDRYKKRWQIAFVNNQGSDNQWAYTVFSDWKGAHTGNPDIGEIAVNPSNPKQYLTGGTSGAGLIHYGDAGATAQLNIGHTYGISQVTFTGGCNTANRVTFDYLGRPFQGSSSTMTSPYGNNRLIVSDCNITLFKDNGQNIVITVKPETGYSYISRKSF